MAGKVRGMRICIDYSDGGRRKKCMVTQVGSPNFFEGNVFSQLKTHGDPTWVTMGGAAT